MEVIQLTGVAIHVLLESNHLVFRDWVRHLYLLGCVEHLLESGPSGALVQYFSHRVSARVFGIKPVLRRYQ